MEGRPRGAEVPKLVTGEGDPMGCSLSTPGEGVQILLDGDPGRSEPPRREEPM